MANCVSALRLLRSWRRYSPTTSGPNSAFRSSMLVRRAERNMARSSGSMGDLLKRLYVSCGGTRSRTYLANTSGCFFMELKCRKSSKAFLGLLVGKLGAAMARTARALAILRGATSASLVGESAAGFTLLTVVPAAVGAAGAVPEEAGALLVASAATREGTSSVVPPLLGLLGRAGPVAAAAASSLPRDCMIRCFSSDASRWLAGSDTSLRTCSASSSAASKRPSSNSASARRYLALRFWPLSASAEEPSSTASCQRRRRM
mmetsp:Transcript_82779/g.219744  ORF Transcript_82779/g.219744 Transcript_82779/m.219744 type:complete len:261 (+) Transcript_82779:259-1041(+)